MSAPTIREALSWSTSSEGFWQRHPLLAWTLQLGIAVPLFIFLASCLLGDDELCVIGNAIFLIVIRLFIALKKNQRKERRLRPSPWFFWW